MDADSNKRKHRQSRHGRRRRRPSPVRLDRSPFQEMDRNHFPSFDAAFGPAGRDFTHDRSFTGSIASSSQASHLDLSIGARAALHEHLRHVEKYGIDGNSPENTSKDEGNHRHQHHQEEDVAATASQEQLQNSSLSSSVGHPLEVQWNQLLDDNASQVNLSWSSSHYRVSPDESFHSTHIVAMASDEHEAVEVFPDVDSDYFNTSKVHLLATPEKNKQYRPPHAVTTRNVSLFDSEEGVQASSDDNATMLHLFHSALNLQHPPLPTHDKENSFLSLSGVDVSRISATDSLQDHDKGLHDASVDFTLFEEHNTTMTPRGSPLRGNHFFNNATRSPSSAAFGAFVTTPRGSPSRSFTSVTTPKRRSPYQSSSSNNNNNTRSQSVFGTPQKTHRSPGLPRQATQRPGSPTLLSPIAARAGFLAGKLLVRPSVHKLADPFPETVFTGQRQAPQELPSPISQANLSEFDPNNSSDLVFLDVSDDRPKSSPPSGYRAGSSSSSRSSVGRAPPVLPPLSDRRRYRTVVPSRVFLAEPTEFPLQDDSFSTQPSSPTTTTRRAAAVAAATEVSNPRRPNRC